MLPRRWPLCGSGMRDLHCKAMPFRPADNSPFRRHYAPMGATRRSLLCLCMCDGFSIAHRWENARIIAEAPPVAEKARRFRGSVPVFTPQRGWNPADTTVFRIAEAPPVAYFSQQFFLFVSDGILFANSSKKYAEAHTVVSADFQPRCGVKIGTLPRNHLASSATGGASAVSAKNHWFLDFLSLQEPCSIWACKGN